MMANTVTPFAADEGVSRANFNSRISEINAFADSAGKPNGLATLDENGKLKEMPTTSDIGAATATHNQAASTITAGTFAGKVVADGTATATVTASQVRNIYAGTGAMTAGTTALTTGVIYVQYE